MLYRSMYTILCSACSRAIDALDKQNHVQARRLLQEALWQTEDMYIEHGEALDKATNIKKIEEK